MSKIPVGCVHGRFQPPHLEHLEYIEEALNRCETLIIGITQPDTERLDACAVDPHRAIPAENPLSYEQRCDCIRDMLVARGVDKSRFSFMQFRIDKRDELARELSHHVVCFTTIRDSWNLEKIHILKELRYRVDVLWDKRDQPGISGTEIRRRIRLGDESWKQLVHPAVAERLEKTELLARIRHSGEGSLP
jgi:cytidyltransferase-like protein